MGIGATIGAFPLFRKKNTAQAKSRSRLITVFHPEASDGTGGKDNANLNDDIIRQMVDQGIMAFTGKQNLRDAWTEIIPDPARKIAIKINCQIQGIYTKAKVVKPITNGLLIRGVDPDNIIIYDKTDTAFGYAGFVKNSGPGIKVGTVPDFGGYHRFFYNRMARLVTGRYFTEGEFFCDYLINVPVLKALDGYSGVTLSMKNHYGTIANPHDHHKDIMTYLPYLNNLPYIREKTRLIIMDAVFVEYKWINGRDQKYVDTLSRIMISDDTVAMDYVGWKMIEEKRKEHGLGPVSPAPVYIQHAAEMGLGTMVPSQKNLKLGES